MSVPSCSKTITCSNKIEDVGYLKKWKHFHNWIHCICVVTFDLELGQAIEVTIFPELVFVFLEDKIY